MYKKINRTFVLHSLTVDLKDFFLSFTYTTIEYLSIKNLAWQRIQHIQTEKRYPRSGRFYLDFGCQDKTARPLFLLSSLELEKSVKIHASLKLILYT